MRSPGGTKLRAAQLAAAAGIATSIVHAQRPADVAKLLGGGPESDVGTTVLPAPRAARSHKKWLLALPVRARRAACVRLEDIVVVVVVRPSLPFLAGAR